MTRERAVRLSLLAYPTDVRAELGGEMTATILDASEGSPRRFARELADLARLGLRARATRTAAAGARRVIADGLCLAGVWLMTLDLSTLLSQSARGMRDPLLAPPSLVLLGVSLALALIGFDRLAGAGALLWTGARLPAVFVHHPAMELAVVAATLPSITCFAVLVLAPRRRARDPRQLAWLLIPATLVATFGPPRYEQSPLLLALVAIAAIAVVVYAMVMLSTDPRVAIAGAIPLTCLGLGAGQFGGNPIAVSLMLATPAALAITVLRIGQLQRRVPL
jgi:hypothetical protein